MKRKSMYSRIPFFLHSCGFFLVLLFQKSCGADSQYEACVPKRCERGPYISYPFFIRDVQMPFCGLFELHCGKLGYPTISIPDNNFVIDEISYRNRYFRLHNVAVYDNCPIQSVRNITLNGRWFNYSDISLPSLHLLSRCNNSLPEQLRRYRVACNNETRSDLELAMLGEDENLNSALEYCQINVAAPVELYGDERRNVVADYDVLLKRGFALNWTASNCSRCEKSGGHCGLSTRSNGFRCFCPYGFEYWICKSSRNRKGRTILLTAVPGAVLLAVVLAIFGVLFGKKKIKNPSYFLSRYFSKSSSKCDLEGGSVYFGVPVFSYDELEGVTNHFDTSKELGDGGFGTVYYGKLRDGREVAVKRLYEHNFKRMAQFMNEVEILTRLRHRNLVSLYGCTSRRSRELLLVYEYIPNGTVADHLHGDRAKDQSLTWPVRMNIAIETAGALGYLHASDIIHRDVKTNNILLDQNFQVKVADFGLSRLFPNDVSHVSTAPQGTPGYVDPEYHQCYQLTDKSDVYSFGVVLIELISSMPAVDISRHRHEINLANLAINRIQRHAFSELIDPSLGNESDPEVMRMTTSVAELAFGCLQLEKEMRPTMDEVVETLIAIRDSNGNYGEETTESTAEPSGRMILASPESDDAVLLKKGVKYPTSPNSVTDIWISGSTTTNSSR